MPRDDDLSTPRGMRSRPFYDPDAFGRFSESIARFLGTGRYLAVQTAIVIVWIIFNIVAVYYRFDPYPFILLNLLFSTQAAYAAPLILLAGNRSALRDRLTLEHAAAEADIEDAQNRELLDGNLKILEHIDTLEHRILELETSILDAVKGRQAPG